MELISLLTEQLGVTDQQAKGGTGLILNMVKSKLNSDEFSQVASAIPETDNLIATAPAKTGVSSMLGGLASSAFGGDSNMGALASLADGFSDLKLDSGMVGKFIPVIMSFLKSRGGDGVSGLLEKVLK